MESTHKNRYRRSVRIRARPTYHQTGFYARATSWSKRHDMWSSQAKPTLPYLGTRHRSICKVNDKKRQPLNIIENFDQRRIL